jgi:hypothetical protein
MLQAQTTPTRVVPITPTVPTLLTPQRISCFSPMTQYEDPSASQYKPQQFPQMSNEPAAVSFSLGLASSGRSPNAHEAPKATYSCEKCDIEFAQPQGLSRHRREIHEPKLCIFCGAFKWGRRYLLRKHLKKMHRELDTDLALDEAMGWRSMLGRCTRRSWT